VAIPYLLQTSFSFFFIYTFPRKSGAECGESPLFSAILFPPCSCDIDDLFFCRHSLSLFCLGRRPPPKTPNPLLRYTPRPSRGLPCFTWGLLEFPLLFNPPLRTAPLVSLLALTSPRLSGRSDPYGLVASLRIFPFLCSFSLSPNPT